MGLCVTPKLQLPEGTDKRVIEQIGKLENISPQCMPVLTEKDPLVVARSVEFAKLQPEQQTALKAERLAVAQKMMESGAMSAEAGPLGKELNIKAEALVARATGTVEERFRAGGQFDQYKKEQADYDTKVDLWLANNPTTSKGAPAMSELVKQFHREVSAEMYREHPTMAQLDKSLYIPKALTPLDVRQFNAGDKLIHIPDERSRGPQNTQPFFKQEWDGANHDPDKNKL